MATNGMTINGLNPLSALTADDKIPVWDTGASGEPTKEITAQNMANSVKSLASLPNTTEMNAAIAQSTAKVKRISFVPPNDLAANSYGYFSVPAPEDIKNKTYISTSIGLGHPASAGGLQLTGTYTGGDYIYLTYYTPRAISKDNSIMIIYIAYYDTL